MYWERIILMVRYLLSCRIVVITSIDHEKNLHPIKLAMDLNYLAQFMRSLHENQWKLNEIKSAYANLALLGQLLCAGTDISRMRANSKEPAAVLSRINGRILSLLSSDRISH